MTGYTPLFGSLTTGTLCGRWPDVGLWPIVLSLADRHGVVDVTPAFIAQVTGLAQPDVVGCMARFCEADPYSRSTAESGARLVLLDPMARNWGWRVVNHGKYREKARKAAHDAERVASGENAERMRARRQAETRDDPTPPATTSGDPLSDKTRQEVREGPRKRGSRIPEDFRPDLGYAQTVLPDIDAAAEAENFCDYWRAKSEKATKVDWPATWRTWIRNCKARGQYARQAQGRGNGLQFAN